MSFTEGGDPRLILALDLPDRAACEVMAECTGDSFGVMKLGLGAVAGGFGIELARGWAAAGRPVFLDLKLFDIEATVRDAVARLADAGLAMLTVQGDPHTVRAAVAGRGSGAGLQIFAVTVLTGLPGSVADVLARARAAAAEGADGVIASGHECAAIKTAVPGLKVVCPGIRPPGAAHHDQQRVMTPAQALAAGADALVIGRPVTAAADPAAAARNLRASLRIPFARSVSDS